MGVLTKNCWPVFVKAEKIHLRFRQSGCLFSIKNRKIPFMKKVCLTRLTSTEKTPALPDYGIYISNHHHGPRFVLSEHKHLYHNLLYIVSGRGECVTNGWRKAICANMAILLRKNQPHQLIDKPSKPMAIFVVYFSDVAARKNTNLLQPLLRLARPIDVPVQNVGYIRKLLRQMLYEQQNRPSMYDISIQLCLSSILLELNRAASAKRHLTTQGTSTERVRRVLKSVKQTHYEPHRLSSAARMACLSQRQFTNLCRKVTGRSFVEYVNEIRLAKAHKLLTDTDVPVSAIAFEVGFEDISTFYRAFRKSYKTAPLSLRG